MTSADVRAIAQLTVPDTSQCVLTTDQIMVGNDPVTGITPEVDLTTDDRNRSVSAVTPRSSTARASFRVEEVGTLNGTFVNGKRIPTGMLTPIADGDSVNFGLVRQFQYRKLTCGAVAGQFCGSGPLAAIARRLMFAPMAALPRVSLS